MEQLQPIQSIPQKVRKIEFKKEIFKYLRVWYWFVLSIAFFYACAKIYLRYTIPVYNSQASVYFNTSLKKNTGVIGLNDLQSLGSGGVSKNSIADEIVLFKAKPLLNNVVKELNLDVEFVNKGKLKDDALYGSEAPFYGKIIRLKDEKKFGGASYKIKSQNYKSYILTDFNGNNPKSYYYDQPYDLGFGIVTISKNPNINFDYPVDLYFKNYKNVAAGIKGGIIVNYSSQDTNILDLIYRGTTPEKSEDIIDELIVQYNKDADNDKKLEARNSEKFINDRLRIISRELSNIEGQKTNFKKENNIFDIETQAQSNISGLDQGTQKILELTSQLEMVNSVLALANASSEQLLPTNIGVPTSAESLISQYNDLIILRNKTLRQATPANPVIIQFNKEIADLKKLIRENLYKSRDVLANNLNYQQSKIAQYKQEMNMFPEQENFLKNIDRQQKIKESLYLYLLQKNEEISMALAVTTPKVKVLNSAFTTGVMTPNTKKIMMFAYGLVMVGRNSGHFL